MPGRKILVIDFLMIALFILATRFATFLHEVLGHAFVALIVGGDVHRIKVSLFGGGMVWSDLGNNHSPTLFIYCLAGIFVNLVTGALPIVFRNSLRRINPIWGLFWVIFVMASILGILAYLVLGLYYNFGDPVSWIQVTPWWLELLWIPFLIITPFVAHFVSRLYVSVQETIFPAHDFMGRLKILLATLGVSSLVYACLFIWTNQELASITAPAAAYHREEARIIEKKKEELAQQLRETYPELTQEKVQTQVDNTPIHVDPKEVPTRFPMIPVLVILYTFGALTALKEETGRKNFPIQPKALTVLVVCFLAVIVVATLAYTDGTIYNKKDKMMPAQSDIESRGLLLKQVRRGVYV
jgi:hypothetical protein